ncbi:oxygenase MpaB family protein [Rhodococcus jostii]|uniref:oxygenase MpaB family protein n=1 Tax=Rhodococcus jostii TaxID=132919 RepID=UPI0036530009
MVRALRGVGYQPARGIRRFRGLLGRDGLHGSRQDRDGAQIARAQRAADTPSRRSHPAVLWRLVGPVLGRLLVWIARGTLPPVARDKLGWEWSADDERRLRRFGAAVRLGFRFVPERWRLTPVARRACDGMVSRGPFPTSLIPTL